MNKTKIPWVKNPDGTPGYSWNPITGCLNGCSYCYARKLANTRLKGIYLANKNWDAKKPEGYEYPAGEVGYPNLDPFYPRFWPEKLEELKKRHWSMAALRKARGIFVCDMSDLFGAGIPEDWTRKVLKAISDLQGFPNVGDRFYLLTKQPQNLVKFSPFPDNCWPGVSATNYIQEINACSHLASIDAKVKYLSLEPVLGQIRPNPNLWGVAGINWIILGSQTKPTVHPKREWVEDILRAADMANIPVFIKEPLASFMGINRQEMPR